MYCIHFESSALQGHFRRPIWSLEQQIGCVSPTSFRLRSLRTYTEYRTTQNQPEKYQVDFHGLLWD